MDLGKRLPLVGREREIAVVREALGDPDRGGILVDGDSGQGKTSLARQALEGCGEEVHWIYPDRVLASVPFGGLAGLLDLDGTQVPSETELTRRLLAALGAPRGTRPIIVVDDAHSLDRQSLAVLAQMVTSRTIRLLALSRRHPAVPEQFLDLVYDRLLQRITLTTLAREDAAVLVHNTVGDIVSWRALDVFYRLSCGNPAVLISMVTTARESGRLVNRGGVWLFDGRALEFDQRLDDVVNLGLSELSGPERRTLELVVLAGEVPVEVMLATGHGTGTDALVLGGFLEVTPGPHPRVRVVNELHATVMARAVPQGRSRRMRRGVESLMTAPTSNHDAWLAWTRWALDCGVQVPDHELLDAGRAAMRQGSLHLARRFFTAIAAERLDVAARLDLAYLYCLLREPLIATDLLHETLSDIRTVDEAFDAALQSFLIRLYLGSVAPVERLEVERWKRAFEQVEVAPEQQEEWAFGRRFFEAQVRGLAGEEPHDIHDTRHRIDDESWSLPVRLLIAVHYGRQACYAGRSESALVHLERAAEFCRLVRAPAAPVWSLYAEALARAGLVDRLEDVIAQDAAADTASAVANAGSADYARALMHRGRGEWEQALVRARASVEALRYWDPAGELSRAAGLAAYLASVVRDTALVDGYLDLLENMDRGGPPGSWIPARARYLTALYLRQGGAEVLEELIGLAHSAREEGLVGIEAEVWILGFGIGADVDLHRMSVLSEDTTDVLPGLASLVGTAILSEDVAVLLSLAQVHERVHPLLAAQVMTQAKRLARVSDDPDDRSMVRQSSRTSQDEALGLELSTRERQVSELIAAGMTNSEIAEYLKIATRTVEGHIYRLFRKLGVTRRSAVAVALSELGHDISSPPVENAPQVE